MSAVASQQSRPLKRGSGKEGERFSCVCGLSYTLHANLLRHQRQKGCLWQQMAGETLHRRTSDESGTRFLCPSESCGKVYVHEARFLRHLAKHEDQKERACQSRVRRGSTSLGTRPLEPALLSVCATTDVQIEVEI